MADQRDDAVRFELRQRFANSLADELATARELLVDCVRELVTHLFAAQDRDRGGRLLEELVEVLPLDLGLRPGVPGLVLGFEALEELTDLEAQRLHRLA